MPDKYNFSDVFISYSRKDRDFVKRIGDALAAKGYEIWADWEDIPQTVDWWAEIKAGIDASNTFVFFVSPNSADSQVCFDEVQHAVENNKRIVPVLCESIDEDATLSKLHAAIRTHNWLNFNETERSFGENLERLFDTLTVDMDYLRQHTRYLVRAREWNDRQRNVSFLLRGTDANEAGEWIESSQNHDPKPLPIQEDYIQACLEQLEKDNELQHQQRALRFVERRTIPTFMFAFFAIWYYTWATLPAEMYHLIQPTGRALIEISFGVAFTAAIIIAVLVLYSDEMVLLRYPNSRPLRLGYSFVWNVTFGSSLSGFLQAMFFGPRLDFVTIFIATFAFGISGVLKTTFKLRGWQSFLIAFISIYAVMNITYASPNNLWGEGRIALFFFNNDTELMTIGIPMTLSIAFGMYFWPLLQDILQLMPEHIQENKIVKSMLD